MSNIIFKVITFVVITIGIAIFMVLLRKTFKNNNIKKIAVLAVCIMVVSAVLSFYLSEYTMENFYPSPDDYEVSSRPIQSKPNNIVVEKDISLEYVEINNDSVSNIDANLKNGGIAYLVDGTIYFRNSNDNGLIYSFNLETHENNPVGDIGVKGYSINVVDNRLYYVNKEEGNTIFEYNIENNQSRLISNQSSPHFRVIGNKLYYISSDSDYGHRLFCIDLEKNVDGIGQLVIDLYTYNMSFANNTIYYVPKISGGMLSSIDLSNPNNPKLYDVDANYINIVDNTIIYQNPVDYKLYIYDGKSIAPIINEYVASVIVHNGRIYYSSLKNDEYGNIFSVDMNGNDKKQISTNPSFIFNIYDNYIFYYHNSEFNDEDKLENKLFLIELDGSGDVISESYFE